MMRIAKALAAGVLAAATALTSGLDDGAVTGGEWMAALVAGIVSGFAVWRIPNQPPSTADMARGATRDVTP